MSFALRDIIAKGGDAATDRPIVQSTDNTSKNGAAVE
jgi:hypothetical protein